jgi:hypothetical protein
MHEVGFEPTITASAQAKTVHALDRAATVTGCWYVNQYNRIARRKQNFLPVGTAGSSSRRLTTMTTLFRENADEACEYCENLK